MTSPQGILKVNGLKAGSHTVRLALAGYRSYEATIDLDAGQTQTVVASLQPVEPPKPKEEPPATPPGPVKPDVSVVAPAAEPPKPPPDPNNPLAPHDPGIYYAEPNGTGQRIVLLEPAATSSPTMKMSSKGALLGGMAGRGGRPSWSSVIIGSTAQLRLTELRPSFFFYFHTGNANAGGSIGIFQSASSPTEFVLVHLTSKKNEREIPTAGVSIAGSASVRPKEAVAFGYEKVAPGIYKITPREDVKPGEYGFLYGGNFQGIVPGGGGWLFDFGIDKLK